MATLPNNPISIGNESDPLVTEFAHLGEGEHPIGNVVGGNRMTQGIPQRPAEPDDGIILPWKSLPIRMGILLREKDPADALGF